MVIGFYFDVGVLFDLGLVVLMGRCYLLVRSVDRLGEHYDELV